jgi:transcriptional regulator with XRE-family HTH domain
MRYTIKGQQLKALRERRYLSQEDLARAAGLHRSTVYRYESADRIRTRPPVIEAIARVLGCPVTEISDDWEPRAVPYSVWFDQEAIKNARAEKGYTLSDVARRTGLSAQGIKTLEEKERPTGRPETIAKVCRALGLKLADVAPAAAVAPAYGELETA